MPRRPRQVGVGHVALSGGLGGQGGRVQSGGLQDLPGVGRAHRYGVAPADQLGGERRQRCVAAAGRCLGGRRAVLAEAEHGVQPELADGQSGGDAGQRATASREGAATAKTAMKARARAHHGTVAQEATAWPAADSTTQTAVNTAARLIRRPAPARVVWVAVMAGQSSHWAPALPTAGAGGTLGFRSPVRVRSAPGQPAVSPAPGSDRAPTAT